MPEFTKSRVRQRPNGRKTGNKNNNDAAATKVAIIGAGFAGLALANYLEKMNITYLVLESKEKAVPIVGTFRLPSTMHAVLSELGILSSTFLLPKDTTIGSELLIPRQDLMADLRKNISVQYSSHVKDVRKVAVAGTEQYYISTAGSDELLLGPFDTVVAANGLSLSSSSSPLWKESCTAVIGDSRWYSHLWYDVFGITRIQKGGAIAMTDGLELGKRLLVSGPQHQQQQQQSSLDHYGISWQRKLQQRKKVVVMCIRMVVLLLLIVFHLYKDRK